MNKSPIKVGDPVTISFPNVFKVRSNCYGPNKNLFVVSTDENPDAVFVVSPEAVHLVVEVKRGECDMAQPAKPASREFKVGDRVRVKERDRGRGNGEFFDEYVGKCGKIFRVGPDCSDGSNVVRVEFDDPPIGHSSFDTGYDYEIEHIDDVPQTANVIPDVPTNDAGADEDDDELDGECVFEPGDVVVLRSGGPDMTVITFDALRGYVCQWFDDNGMTHSEGFPAAALAYSVVERDIADQSPSGCDAPGCHAAKRDPMIEMGSKILDQLINAKPSRCS